MKLFVDDIKLYFDFVYDDIFSSHKLQSDLNALAYWAKQWQLDISIPMTFILNIGSNNPKLPHFICGKLLSTSDCIKDLGVYIIPNPSWHSHCIKTTKKANFIAN